PDVLSLHDALPIFDAGRCRQRGLNPQYADSGLLDRRVEGGLEREAEHHAAVPRVDDAIVPETGGAEVGLGLALVALADLALGLGPLLWREFLTSAADRGQHAGGLLAAHDRRARGRPSEQEARVVAPARHGVVAGPVARAGDQGDLGHLRRGDRCDHIRAIPGDAAVFGLAADQEAGD